MPRTSWGRGILLGLVALLGLGVLANSQADWFPRSWDAEFYAVKGLLGIVAVLVMLVHMSRAWPHIGTLAQRLRYLLLLGFVVVVGAASSAQYEAGAPVTGRNLAAFVLAGLTIPVAIVSMRQDRRR
jgi:hypothetical protein